MVNRMLNKQKLVGLKCRLVEKVTVCSMFTKTSVNDFGELYNTNVLGLKERSYNQNHYLYEKFKKQLKRDEERWHEKELVLKEGNLPLADNKNRSVGRVKSLV